jgi:hypothetical protein
VVVALGLAACTSGGDGAPDERSPTTSPPPVTSAESYVFTDAAGIEARLTLRGEGAELTVRNDTGGVLPKPGVFVLDARDGVRTTWRVLDAAPVPDGERASFEVERSLVPEARHIGLVVLLIGGEDFGAFVPPRPGDGA